MKHALCAALVSLSLWSPTALAEEILTLPPSPPPVCGNACWTGSFAFPGVGQILLEEPERGLWFMGGSTVLPWGTAILSLALLEAFKIPGWSGPALQQAVPAFMLAAGMGTTAGYVWSVVDAYQLQQQKYPAPVMPDPGPPPYIISGVTLFQARWQF